jgi:hypothetical protein
MVRNMDIVREMKTEREIETGGDGDRGIKECIEE